jgi:hypothetical protein
MASIKKAKEPEPPSLAGTKGKAGKGKMSLRKPYVDFEEPMEWANFSQQIETSEDGLTALKNSPGFSWDLITTNAELVEKKYMVASTGDELKLWYWEVEIITAGLGVQKLKINRSAGDPKPKEDDDKDPQPGVRSFFVGVARPGLNEKGFYGNRLDQDGWFMNCSTGSISGNGADAHDFIERGVCDGFVNGDRLGVLLDLNKGQMKFFKNGMSYGPGFPPGSVTGPVYHAAQLYYCSDGIRMIPDAPWPEGYTQPQ